MRIYLHFLRDAAQAGGGGFVDAGPKRGAGSGPGAAAGKAAVRAAAERPRRRGAQRPHAAPLGLQGGPGRGGQAAAEGGGPPAARPVRTGARHTSTKNGEIINNR
eukprot:1184712-Prorocentrum_minimum.AAC.1